MCFTVYALVSVSVSIAGAACWLALEVPLRQEYDSSEFWQPGPSFDSEMCASEA